MLKLLFFTVMFGLSPLALAEKPITTEELRDVLMRDYGFSTSGADYVLEKLARANPQDLPIQGMITTRGRSLTIPYKRKTQWKNVWTRFYDDSSDTVIATNCLYDMLLTSGGAGYSMDLRYMMMFLVGSESAGNLDRATFGTGGALSFTPGLGFEVSYLPSNTHDSSLIMISLQAGWGAGIFYPTIEFVRTQTCPR